MIDLNQAKNLIVRAQNILILPSQESPGDNLVSALALLSTLRKLGKNVNVSIDKIPEKFQFLSNQEPEQTKEFIISLNSAGKEISKMRYEKNTDELKIYLAIDKGTLSANDISFAPLYQDPDILITIGIKSLKELKESLKNNSSILDKTLVLNIDNSSLNESFGEINLVDTNSCSAEILTDLIRFMETESDILLDENIATYLLTGIVCSSQNFRNPGTHPRIFDTSAYLIERGGNHQKIIQNLYKQKSIPQINLLGKILEKMDLNKEKELYSASLSEEDFEEARASSKDLGFVIEEIKLNFRYLPNLLILWEGHNSPKTIKGILYSIKRELIEKLLQKYEGVSKKEVALFSTKEANLDLAKENILNIL
ncbi:MAG: hypothetical protein Q8P63_02580 [Candidatus Nealsonbacteria bacterium]|nr:hypothetical protein [Candidatus Nealsonbacteria bacterium]